MISFNIIWLLSLIGVLLTTLILFVIAKLFYKSFDKETFLFKRVFPFEVINRIEKGFNAYKTVLFLLVVFIFLPVFCFGSIKPFYENFRVFSIVISSLFGLAGVCFLFLHFFNPSNIKSHTVLVSIMCLLVFVTGLMTTFNSYEIYKASINLGEENLSCLIFGGLASVFSLFEIASIFTFNLFKWATLEKKEETLKRPDFFPLAAFEWLSIILLVLEEVCFLLSLLA